MRIGILSDTHNNQGNLKRALQLLVEAEIGMLVHCGDVTTVETALLMAEYRLIYVYGNLDEEAFNINRALSAYNSQNYCGTWYSGEIDGIQVAAIHGDQPGRVDELARSGKYRYVLHGHTHRHRQQQIGETWVINPGALGGARLEPRSVCVLDLASDETEFLTVGESG